ncbi:OmpA family protein [Paraliomyxa miuraensis]|uniref:OmpA family protein n=1 Tax=Paraliomyxa miuraensis TaxID=376150 RepID=UPI0022563AB6|nr:OmpA family protein [Paraliomyxa miuraensis]MCX4242174.1 OmpA family protein [Paraliomyxa miuraensis]
MTSPSAADEAKAATPSSSAGAPSDDVAPAPKTDAPAPKEPAAIDLLTLGAGAVVVSSSPAAEKASLVALDGDDRTTTIGIPRKEPLPHVFVVEMPAATTFERFEVPKIDEFGAAKGRHVKTVRLEGSSTAADQGFSPLLEFELRAGVDAAQGFAVKEPRAIRWLRVTFVDRMEAPPSDVDSARFSDLRGFGSQETIVVPPGTFEGRWRLRRLGINDEPGLNVIELWQRGDELGGCQSLGGQQSTISGSIVDGLARLVAENDKGQRYPSTARVTTAGELVGMSFNGPARVYYAAPDPSAAAPCTPPREPTNAVAQALKDGHVAVLYGIHFDVDQDVLRPSAKPALEQLLAALKATPTLSVVIEGHTDAQGSDAHNLDLSQRRAAAVVQWLTERGIAASQLSAEGRGEAEPIADNETSAGRALNRRVEVEPRPSP